MPHSTEGLEVKMKPVGDWKIGDGTIPLFAHFTQIVWTFESGDEFILASFNSNFEDIARDAAARAVVCRNALQGIADPAAFVREAKEAAAEIKGLREAGQHALDTLDWASGRTLKDSSGLDIVHGASRCLQSAAKLRAALNCSETPNGSSDRPPATQGDA